MDDCDRERMARRVVEQAWQPKRQTQHCAGKLRWVDRCSRCSGSGAFTFVRIPTWLCHW